MLRAARCCGFTRDGAPCRWTAGANFPVTAPLESGGRYCAYHINQEKKPKGKQLSLTKFLSPTEEQPPDEHASLDETQGEEPRRLQAHASDVALSQTQQDLIKENREKAVARRQLRAQNSDATLSEEQQAKIEENRKKALERRRLREHSSDANLSDEQQTLINENRQKALERRRLREHSSDANLSDEQQSLITINRQKAFERRRLREQKSDASFLDVSSPARQGIDYPSTPRAASSSRDRQSLTPVQLSRIAEQRAQAIEKQQIKAQASTVCEIASAHTPVVDTAEEGETTCESRSNMSSAGRSRTPPQKNRRRLYEHTTGTPVARPPRSLGNIAAVHAKSNNFEALHA